MRIPGFILLLQLVSSFSFSQVISLNGSWKFHINDKSMWSSPHLDDSQWESISVPSPWEDEGFNGYDGFAWYRKKFDGRKLDKNENYYLGLGFIDDCDEVFVNGKLIGFSGFMPPHCKTAYNKERRYILLPDVINFSGENTIAIRVFDLTLSGGITDGNLGIFKMKKAQPLLIDLQGIWSFATNSDDNVKNNKKWEKIMVPSPWEYQGYYGYDGFAWYKRTFTIPPNVASESLVLVLGKIDDFDKVYLNGQMIGSTNDHKPYGRSGSYQQVRAYEIPSDLLRKDSPNTVEVLVEDLGNIGGIYEGPVGITTKSNFEKKFVNRP